MDLFDLYVKISANTSEYTKAVGDAQKSGKKLSESFTDLSSKSEANRNKMKVLGAQYSDARKKVDELTTAFNKSAKENGVTAEKTQKLAEELKEAEEKAASLKEEINGSSDAVEKAGSVFSGFGSRVKNAFSTAASVAAAGVAAVSAALGTLSVLSIQSYADYEQLVGGVETIFGAGGQSLEEYAASVNKTVEEAQDEYSALMKSQQTVIDNADKAYKTAGLSANDYMQTVTGFSASLLQSLDGDTQKAAEYADRALVDMADNVNKYGSNMTDVQNAYQGFAKQNYTMLDNLKLGYGGTQEEMKRLIKDASKMTDVQEKLGITVDSSSMSFGNIINAISVMQEEMGIAGTTSKEASTTISGSIAQMKAQWENLLTALTAEDWDVGVYVTNFADTVKTVIDNVAPRIVEALPNISAALGTLFTSLAPYLSTAVQTLLPALVQGAITLVASLAAQLPQILSVLASTLQATLQNVFNILPADAQASIVALGQAFMTLLPAITGVAAAVVTFRTAMTIAALIQGVTQAIAAFKAANEAATIAQAALNAVMNLNPFILIATLIAGVVVALVTLWNTNEGFRNAVIAAWEAVKSGIISAVEAVKTAVNGVVNFFKNLGETITSTFDSVVQSCLELGGKIVTGIMDGISAAWDGLVGWFNGLWEGAFGNKTANVTVNRTVNDTGAVDGSHANGLNYVPFDGYIAELHKREAVLTAAEAEDWRKGRTGGGVNVYQTIYAAKQTPVELAATTKAYFQRARWAL